MIALFVDGCFWHGCPVHSNMPRNNQEFWEKKLLGNKVRDRFVTRELKKLGWKVVRVWEHELKSPDFFGASHMRAPAQVGKVAICIKANLVYFAIRICYGAHFVTA